MSGPQFTLGPAMRPRFLGVLLVVLAVLGGLNLVQAIRARLAPDAERADRTEAHRTERADRASGSQGVYLDESFQVSDGELLVIDVQHADIDIETGYSGKARLVVTIEAPEGDRARELFEMMRFEAYREDGRVVLRSDPRDDWSWRGRMDIDIRALIPERFDLELQSTHGDVTLGSLDGSVELHTTHGDIQTARIMGSAVSLNSTHGDVQVAEIVTPSLVLHTTHGDIAAGALRSERIDAVTTHSDIDVRELSGSGELLTTHGDVSIRIARHDGLQIRTTHGDVLLVIPDDLPTSLNLRGEHVTIPSGASFDGSLQDEQAKGLLNGGGPAIEVSTSFGDVVLRTN